MRHCQHEWIDFTDIDPATAGWSYCTKCDMQRPPYWDTRWLTTDLRVRTGNVEKFVSEEELASYILRNIDPTIWEQFKARAATEGHALRWLLLEMIRRYVVRGLD